MRFVDDIDWDRYAEQEALVVGRTRRTYAELQRATARCVELLLQQRVAPHEPVLVVTPKGAEAVAALLAIAHVGAVAVPLDPDLPLLRAEYVLRTTHARVALCHAEESRPSGWSEDLCWISLEHAFDEHRPVSSRPERRHSRAATDLACILFTSGSTGTPKGVMLRHESLSQVVASAIGLAGYKPRMRYLNVAPFHFDAAITDLYCTLALGGTLILVPRFSFPSELAELMQKERVTDTLLPSAVVRLLASDFVDLSRYRLEALQTLWYGGEACPVAALRRIKTSVPQLRFIHGYGPTETTHTASALVFEEIPRDALAFMPIGFPLPGVSMVALGEDNQPIRNGEVGELYIGGTQLMAGYCDDPERTRSVLVQLPHAPSEGPFYKTGDFVTQSPDGAYVFRERRDDLLKCRGHLVSLTEVERAFLQHARVRDAYALAAHESDGNVRLHVVLVLDGGDGLQPAELIAGMHGILPSCAIPHVFHMAGPEDIPRTDRGKTDRNALRDRFMRPAHSSPGGIDA